MPPKQELLQRLQFYSNYISLDFHNSITASCDTDNNQQPFPCTGVNKRVYVASERCDLDMAIWQLTIK